jgi:hypothetical protein
MLRGGAIKRGEDLLKAASDIRKGEAQIESDEAAAAENRVETVLKGANVVAQTVGVARNQSEWQYGLAQLRKAGVLPPEQLEKLEAMDYDPDVVAYLNTQALSAYQKALLDQTSQRDATSKRQADDRIANARRLTSIAEGRLKIAEKAEARAEKAGKGPTAPNSDQLKAAKAAVISQVFNGTAPTTADAKAALDAGAVSIASRTQQLLRENKALDFDTAQNRAIIESQTAGDWEVVEPSMVTKVTGNIPIVGSFVDDSTKIKFRSAGKTAQTALPLPPKGKSLIKGRFYTTAKGVAKWDGQSFIAAE